MSNTIFKLGGLALVGTLLGAVFFIVNSLGAYALNVHTEIKADPPGIARIINQSGNPPPGIDNPKGNAPAAFTIDSSNNLGNPGTVSSGDTPPKNNQSTPPPANTPPPPVNAPPPPVNNSPPPPDKEKPPPGAGGGGGAGGAPSGPGGPNSGIFTALTINTDIEFGTVFPGETLEGKFFIIYLTDTELEDPPGHVRPFTRVEYLLTFGSPGGGYLDLTPYLTVVRDPAETGEPADTVTSASLDSSLPDNSDKWLVTLTLPNDPPKGNYWMTITVEVTSTTP